MARGPSQQSTSILLLVLGVLALAIFLYFITRSIGRLPDPIPGAGLRLDSAGLLGTALVAGVVET